MNLSGRKAFTLVELLIMIVVIGVLSAMMMLSSTEAVASARATKVINDLHEWKTALLSWYMDNIDRVTAKGMVLDNGSEKEFASGVISTMEIAKYINGEFTSTTAYQGGAEGAKDASGGRYYIDHLKVGNNYYKWYICYVMPNEKDDNLKGKLEARAASAGLWSKNPGNGFDGVYTKKHARSQCVAIEVIDFSE